MSNLGIVFVHSSGPRAVGIKTTQMVNIVPATIAQSADIRDVVCRRVAPELLGKEAAALLLALRIKLLELLEGTLELLGYEIGEGCLVTDLPLQQRGQEDHKGDDSASYEGCSDTT